MSSENWRATFIVTPFAFGLGLFNAWVGGPLWMAVSTGVAMGLSIGMTRIQR